MRSGLKQFLALPSAMRTAAWFTILTVPAAVAAYYRIFSGFAEWDDEGSIMMTVRQYLAGGKLYEEVFSPYGPVYFYYNRLLRSVTGNVLNHNAVRITSAALSLLCALICAWIVLRLTKSLAAASVTHLLVFRVLSFFTYEPGHPQELCLLLLLCLAGSGTVAANPRYVWLAMTAAGSIAAALTLVKVNIGIFALLAVAMAVLFQATPGWLSRLAK
jgi:4-amino-4-deoxy-L-arabinose transferase-like glycosyltransferase